MRIGIAGTGRMGTAIALRLLDCGHQISVWNRTAVKTDALARAGAAVAETPAQLAAASEIVISMLSDADAVRAIYLGDEGLLRGEVAGRLFVEMSTVRPEIKVLLANAVHAKGADMVDCPVGGTIGPAREGRLLGFAGGSAPAMARAAPLLHQLCRRVEHVGAVGAGASMKLAINLPLLVYWQALGEALVLCDSLNLDPARLIDIFADTSGGPNLLKGRGGAIAAALAGGDPGQVTFDVDSIRKDLRTMIDEAHALGATLPLAERALECFDQAARSGLGGADGVLLPARWVSESRHHKLK
jgi:3-hydroxyisobutyrate dehydrogenase